MTDHLFHLGGQLLTARPSGALWWDDERLLCVSDLHLGKSERMARRGGALLPPYENQDTLARLAAEVDALDPLTVVCLGDSFDDMAAAEALQQNDTNALSRLIAGRQWVWIEGNHDPGPVEFGGAHLAELVRAPLTFRHIAKSGAEGEISGHYHPKARVFARGRVVTRAAFLRSQARLILPAFGTYTGGMRADEPPLAGLMDAEATALLTGGRIIEVPIFPNEQEG